ncbi:MAG: DUF2007 domain-containing protein [Anaerolineae bacterium]|nr:DUF2007 domain-containing protein [Anaerolineae bacterium]
MGSQHKTNKEKLVVVATVSGMLHAQVLRAQLEDAGILVLLDYESAGVVFGITAPGLKLSEVRILVREQDIALARQILAAPPAPGWEDESEAFSEPD